MKPCLSILSILLFSVFVSFANPFCDVSYYSGTEGFRNNSAIDILQAKNGLIWISTRNGLTQFDGYTFRNYKSYPGDGCAMNDSRINIIRENSLGDIWCLSQDGRAYLFDISTQRFKDIFKHVEPEISHPNIVSRFFVLKKGVSWVVCRDRYAFRVEDDKCKSGKGISFFGPEKNIKGESINWIAQDKDGDEWVLTNRGISIIGEKTVHTEVEFHYFMEMGENIFLASTDGKLATYSHVKGVFHFIAIPPSISVIHSLDSLNGDTITLGTNAGLLLINTKNQTSEQIRVDKTLNSTEDIYSMYQDSYGDYWLLGETGVFRYDKTNKKLGYHQSPKNDNIRHEKINKSLVFEDNYGRLWLVPENGNFCYFDRKKQELIYYYTDPENPSTLISPSIKHYFIDHQRNIWFGANNSFGKISFYEKTYHIIPKENDELEVRALFLDSRNELWVASKDHKLKILDSNHQTLHYTLYDAFSLAELNIDFNIYSIFEDNHGNIWLGSRLRGLYLLKRDTHKPHTFSVQRFRHDNQDSLSLSDNNVYSIFQDSRDRIWVGTYGGGLNLIEQNETGEIHFIHSGNRLKNYPAVYAQIVRYITEVNNTMLIACMHGLFSFSSDFESPGEIQFFRNMRNEFVESSLSNNDVMYIFTDSRKQSYLLTLNGGINKIVSNNLLSDNVVFEVLSQQEGFASDLTLSMTEDDSGDLWIASKQDLTRFNPSTTQINNFGSYFFKQEIFFSESAAVNTPNGKILFGTNKGILEIDPSRMTESNFVPPVVFTELKLNNQPLATSADHLENLELKPAQRNFSIQFSALDFNNSKGIKYAYMLEGLENEWHYVNENRSADYINIPKGHYRFLVRSTNGEGVWVDNQRHINISVLPTFWETPWAWLIYFVLFVVLVSCIVYVLFIIYRLKHKVTLEQQLSEIKLRFFTDISHELRTPLTLISSPVSDVLEHEELSALARENLSIAQRNSNRLLYLVNQILDFRKIQANKMKMVVEETEICGFVSLIMENFQFKAREKEIHYLFRSNVDKICLWIDRDKFEKIIFNLLSNAFKYTPQGKSIGIEIHKTEEAVSFSITDEGIGIPSTKTSSLFQRFETIISQNIMLPSSGIGLSLVKELIELHHGSVDVYSELGIGSTFTVKLPLGNAHFMDDPQVEFMLSDHKSVNNSSPKEREVHPFREEEPDRQSILIVEDNLELMNFLHNILSKDYYVLEAFNGQEGLNKSLEMIPDIIISDVKMPVMDGLDMVKELKNNTNTCHIPIVLLSSKASLDDRINALESGIDDYITKPFSTTYLRTRISTLLAQRKLLQGYYLDAFSKKQPTLPDLQPSQPKIASYDEVFIKQVMTFLELNMDNASLAIEDLAQDLSMSRSVMYKKIKTLFGLSPVDFIRNIRIKRAVQLIETSDHSFTEIAYLCGFNDLSYFGKCFKKQVGLSPSDYKLKNK